MQDSWVLIEQAINKAVTKGAYNLAEVQSILQAMGDVQHIINIKTKEQSDNGGTKEQSDNGETKKQSDDGGAN